MTIDTHQLFNNPPTSFFQAIRLVFSIFGSNWKPFVLISIFYYIAMFVVFFFLGLIFAIVFAETIAKISSSVSSVSSSGGGFGDGGYYARHLLDYSIGTGGASRALENYYDDFGNNADVLEALLGAEMQLMAIGFELILMYILLVVAATFVSSIFTGALTHAVAEVYTGGSPSTSRSLAYGWQQKLKVYVFQVLLSLAVLAILLVDVGIPASAHSYKGIFIGLIIAIVMLVSMGTVLLGAIPAIVVENKNPVDAFKRSWNLCKDYFCFIFCNNFIYHIMVFAFMIAINKMLTNAPALISMIIHFLVNVTTSSIAPIFVFVLYMSIRIRSEQVTGQELSDELSDIVPIANAIEMMDDYNDNDSKDMV